MVFTVMELSWMFSVGYGFLYFPRGLTVTSRGEFDVILFTCVLQGLCCEGYGCPMTAKSSWIFWIPIDSTFLGCLVWKVD